MLAGTEGPAHTWKLPITIERQLEKLAMESGADVIGAWRQLLARAEKAPFRMRVTVGEKQRNILLGPGGLQYILRRDVGDTNDWPLLPAAIFQAARGDVSLLGRAAARRFSGLSGGVNLLPIAVDCASATTPERLKRIESQEPSPLFGTMTNFPFPAACQALDLPPLPERHRDPVSSSVPTLFVSGTHDSNTPPEQAAEVAARFVHAAHVIVDNAGHESTLVPDVRAAIADFLEEKPVASRRVSAPPVRFLPLDYKPKL